MLAAARAASPATAAASAAIARAHQDAFLDGMDRIVALYEEEARDRVVGLRRVELALLAVVLAAVVLVGALVFRPAVRSIRAYVAERDDAQHALLQTTDREQQRIAQDLHDGLGQELVGVSYLVQSLRGELAGDARAARLDEIGRLLAASIEATRGLARSLHSPTLEVVGLTAALRELAAHTEHVFEVDCRVTAPTPEVDVAMPVRGHLYRIAREALINSAKHARAKLIEIEVVHVAGRVTVAVRDDGVGFEPAVASGMGLRLMESRAKMIGATLSIEALASGGTRVVCTLPPSSGARAP
jgi:signal transduction histidine kinase